MNVINIYVVCLVLITITSTVITAAVIMSSIKPDTSPALASLAGPAARDWGITWTIASIKSKLEMQKGREGRMIELKQLRWFDK